MVVCKLPWPRVAWTFVTDTPLSIACVGRELATLRFCEIASRRVLAVRRRDLEPPLAYPPLISHIFFTDALNEICLRRLRICSRQARIVALFDLTPVERPDPTQPRNVELQFVTVQKYIRKRPGRYCLRAAKRNA